MKYPQLVSTKAVNEISDWLIKRLEDLDIEHPGVYSRLLLSLLHTPFKVNAIDLLEDLKQPHHLFNKSNEELKRLAAVESLMEVSVEQNKSNIINLVDELHSKLRKIETTCEESSMNTRTSNSLSSSSPISNSKLYKNLKKIKKNHGMENSTKNYYLAFPALNGGGKNLVSSTTSTQSSVPVKAAPASNETNTTFPADIEMHKETNLNLLSWSNLISKKNDDTSTSSKLNENNERSNNSKTPLSRRKRRYGRTRKSDVQFSAKSLNAYDMNATFSPKKMQMVKNSGKKHQRYDSSKTINNKNCDIRNNNNFSKNAPKMDLTSGSAPIWDMDFKGQWEMDRDLISEFIQQQKGVHHNYNNNHHHQHRYQQKQQSRRSDKAVGHKDRSCNNSHEEEQQQQQQQQLQKQLTLEDEDDVMLKCLPSKLIVDESLVDDSFCVIEAKSVRPCNNKEAFSISSLKSKFDENVKAIWSDVDGGNDLMMKPLTYKHFNDDVSSGGGSGGGGGAAGGGTFSLASSFASEKNCLSLFNFSEQTHHFDEVNAPSNTEIYHHQHPLQQHYPSKNVDYDYNNNNNSNNSTLAFYGGRGAMSKSGSSFTASPAKLNSLDQMIRSSDFIKSGTNLQTSIWSDGGDYPSDAESLILKEVTDPKDDAVIYKNLSSIGDEVKNWQKQESNSKSSCSNDESITLFNHSHKSAFKKFRPLLTSSIIRANYHPLNVGPNERTIVVESLESSDSYLTSEKTHFNPIIRDGHSFVIDNNWDEINYERSPSGSHLLYKNHRYKLWNNSRSSKSINIDEIDLLCIESDTCEFQIKYMLSETDKECQTNESDFVKQMPQSSSSNRSFMEISEEYCKRKIYDEYFKNTANDTNFIGNKNKWRYINNSEDSNDYSFFSVNRVKDINNLSNPSVNNNSNTLNPHTFHNILLSSNSSSSSICTITSSYDASAAHDQFESWRNIKYDQNDSEYKHQQHQKQICMHRLWEQCVTCSKNIEDLQLEKPLPASRLMKDELQLDGDEIMNVIQNLYITGDYCDDDEEEKDDICDDFDMNHVYMNMILDDSMDTCTLEDDNKFYESTDVDAKNQKNFSSNIVEGGHQKEQLMNLENFDEITLSKMQWQMDKNQDTNKDYEKYLKLLNWIKSSLVTTVNSTNNFETQNVADKNNNICQLDDVHRLKNRKRRHSTCQNFLDNKRTTHDEGITYRLNFDGCSFSEDYSNLFFDAAKMLKVNIEKILLIEMEPNNNNSNNNHGSSTVKGTQIEGANYYRNILQQQHALIKQLDLSRPLTR